MYVGCTFRHWHFSKLKLSCNHVSVSWRQQRRAYLYRDLWSYNYLWHIKLGFFFFEKSTKFGRQIEICATICYYRVHMYRMCLWVCVVFVFVDLFFFVLLLRHKLIEAVVVLLQVGAGVTYDSTACIVTTEKITVFHVEARRWAG